MYDQPLTGTKVIDLSNHIAGSFCTKQLADYGADVIKIEKCGSGCHTRHMAPYAGNDENLDASLYHLYLNANKKSMTLNLKSETGRTILKHLVKDADILVQSFSPNVMERLGLDYQTLEEINPRLVVAAISNFGQAGPYRDYKASELIEFAMGGAMASTGLPGEPPTNKGRDACLFETGLQAWYAILGVYMGTLDDGEGDFIDLSIQEVQLAGCERRSANLLTYQYTGDITLRTDPLSFKVGIVPVNVKCKDGFMQLGLLPKYFNKILELIGRPDLAADERWHGTNMELEEEFQQMLDECLSKKTKIEWSEIFQDEGLICTPLNKPEDVCSDPHWQARNFFFRQEHPQAGTIRFPRGPVRTDTEWWRMKMPAPALGQHTREILTSLNYTPQDIDALYSQEII